MTMPGRYRRASEDFDAYLEDIRADTLIDSRNVVYTMTQGVFQTFRCRLDVADALRFADVLPPVLRAIFVADWNPDEAKRPFEDRDAMTREVQALRGDHNFSPDTVIRDVAMAVRKHVDAAAFDRVLKTLPDGAEEFWQP
ncbi:DUF2267 domain-containing protein [Rhizobium leguminosarum]|uniref:DUF2267 domain-containing protein n=1 Tax=Rhizobium TaxID=379 RepID=UPI001389F592|nr:MULTISPECIES: DUF2267 domain-containing protein [Rhizobium]MBY5353501.1 DUF2267 domain-containing protein [Rhizobium leguminosarum]NDK50681.1 DUF2267 domain-containing protein [Rhizobium laguerreae]NNH41627.1 DUF2267 domain-containing protein [Rhizobium laguerreae]